jgi:hypothetical protein
VTRAERIAALRRVERREVLDAATEWDLDDDGYVYTVPGEPYPRLTSLGVDYLMEAAEDGL